MKEIIFEDIRDDLSLIIHAKTRFKLQFLDYHGEYRLLDGLSHRLFIHSEEANAEEADIILVVCVRHSYTGEIHELDLGMLMPELLNE